MNDLSSILLIVIAVVLSIVALVRKDKNKIRIALLGKGFRQIKLKRKWGGNEDTSFFEVEYLDRNGKLRRNSCVIHTRMFSGDEIFWEKPLK